MSASDKTTESHETCMLRDQIRCVKPKTWDFLSLLEQSTQHKSSDNGMLNTFGPELCKQINDLQGQVSVLYGKYDIQHLFTDVPSAELNAQLRSYIVDNQVMCQITDQMIDLVKRWIETHTVVVPSVVSDELLKEVQQAHSREWIKQAHVYELYNDGEILTTKGDYLYGQRSFFTVAPPLNTKFEWEFPIKKDSKFSYAIVQTQEKAEELRAKMEQLTRGQTKGASPP